MIAFRHRTLWESLRYRFSRSYREERDQAMREAIKWLVQHPSAPCSIEGNMVNDGYGHEFDYCGNPRREEWQ